MEKEEHLIVTAPVTGDLDIFLSRSMGQDEPVDPVGGPLKISIQTIEEEQPQDRPDAPDSDIASSSMKEMPEMAKCTDLPSEEPRAAVPILDPSLVLDTNQALISDESSAQNGEPAGSPAVEQPEEKLDQPELRCDESKPNQKTKTSKSKPPSLKVSTSVNRHEQTCEEQELPIPKGAYEFDLDRMDESFNPFTSGGSKIPNSPPPCGSGPVPVLEPPSDVSSAAPADEEMEEESSSSLNPKSMMLEFGLDEGPVSKPPPKKLGSKKGIGKLATKKQKAKASEVPQPASEPASDPLPEPALPETDSPAPLNLDDVPIPKTGAYNFDPSKWDDPDFNPFGSNSKVSSSPTLPKGSYAFDPDNFDDSLDPFKPSKSLSTEEPGGAAGHKVPDKGQQKAEEQKKARQIPRKSKERAAA